MNSCTLEFGLHRGRNVFRTTTWVKYESNIFPFTEQLDYLIMNKSHKTDVIVFGDRNQRTNLYRVILRLSLYLCNF